MYTAYIFSNGIWVKVLRAYNRVAWMLDSLFSFTYCSSLYSCGYIHYMGTNRTWQSYYKDKSNLLFPTFSYILHFLLQFLNIVFESGVVPQVWFSSQGNIFHSNRSHWLACCLPVDHFWALTNVTVLQMTTFIFNRAWHEKWKWKHRNSSPALKLKHRSVHKSPGFSTPSYRGFHGALSHTAAKCNMYPHNETQTCMPYSVPGGTAKKTPSLVFLVQWCRANSTN